MFLPHRIDLNSRLSKRHRPKAGPGKLPPGTGHFRPAVEYLEQRELLAVTVFQQGVGGYAGTQDTSIFALAPDFVGAFPSVTVSGPTNGALGRVQGLIRFDNL